MKATKILFAVASLIASTALLANGNYRNQQYIYAPVVDVQPVYDRNQSARYDQCMYQSTRYRNESKGGGAVIGGLLGGLIGNRFGKGNGRKAATAVGVIIGASIGAENSKHNRHRNQMAHRECQRYASEDRVIGFDVSYDYNGKIYQTFMHKHPGERVRLEVDVQVAEY